MIRHAPTVIQFGWRRYPEIPGLNRASTLNEWLNRTHPNTSFAMLRLLSLTRYSLKLDKLGVPLLAFAPHGSSYVDVE